MAPTFVGRVAELASIERLCTPGLSGDGNVAVLVEGPPGSGKTRLLREVEKRLVGQPCLRIRGYQASTVVPLGAAAGMLRSLAAGSADDMLGSVFGIGSKPLEGPLETVRLFEAAWRALGATTPALITIDDLQWVDDGSLALLEYLLRAALSEGKSLAMVAVSRPSAATTAFGDAAARELGSERMRVVRLGPLAEEDGVRMAQQMAPDLNAMVAAQLWREADGWPFWLEQLVASGGRRGLAEQLSVRLRSASADGGRLVALLAAAARPLAVDEIALLSSWSESRSDQATADLVRLGIADVSAGAVAFTHDLVREAADRVLPEADRRQLHGRLAERLESEAAGDIQALRQALWHRMEAGADALELALRMARSPQRRLLGAQGVSDLGRVADGAGDRGLPLQEEVARLAAELGEHRDALVRWRRVADRHPEPRGRAWAALQASKAAAHLIEHREEAMDLLRRARAESAVDPVLEVELDAQEANLLRLLRHRTDEARTVADRAAAGARGLLSGPAAPESESLKAALAGLVAAYEAAVMDEDHGALVGLAEEMLTATRGSEEGVLVVTLTKARTLQTVGRLREAAELGGRVWEEAKQQTMPALQLAAGPTHISMLRLGGHLAEADSIGAECVEIERRLAGPTQRLAIPGVARRSARVMHSVILMSRGRWKEGMAGLEREATLEPDSHYRIHINQERALWLSRLGSDTERPAALARLAEADQDSRRARCRRCSRELALRSAEVRARLGAGAAARRLLGEWDRAPGTPEAIDGFWREHVEALVEISDGQAVAGASALASLADRRREHGLLHDRLWSLLDAGEALALAGGQAKRGADALRQAAMEAAEMGAITEQGRAEQLLRRLGVRTWRRPPAAKGESPAERLSPRQREIARLVASGATNREIGERLFLSPKTVERHISNIYAQAGVRNRAELAALLGTGG